MKDYYYIIGINKSATAEEIKKAYRKLATKFHPDKNDGDEFFAERFKEIQEAYETLSDLTKRKVYDEKSNIKGSRGYSGGNFSPEIDYFKSNKQAFSFNDEVTFIWKTINADRVILKPFGMVEPIGQRTYKLKDFKNPNLTFELIAENTNISRQIKSSLTLTNITYGELYLHFKSKIKQEEEIKKSETNKPGDKGETDSKIVKEPEEDETITHFFWFLAILAGIFLLVKMSNLL